MSILTARKPVVQQVQMLMDSYKEDFKQSDDRLDGKIDMLIQLQRDHLALEREKLAFERGEI